MHLLPVVTSWVTSFKLHCIAFFSSELWGEVNVASLCSTQYVRTTKMRRAPCRVLSATQLPAVLSCARLRLRIHHRGPPPVTHDVSRLTRRPCPAAPSYAYRNSSRTVTYPSLLSFSYTYTGLIIYCIAHFHEEAVTFLTLLTLLHVFSRDVKSSIRQF